ncbi:MAG: methyltransferase domain-containing protein, partial [Chloroflexota bacterium]
QRMYSERMAQFKLKLSAMAHGGQALGRDKRNQVIFVAGGIPGEMVLIDLEENKDRKKYLSADLVRVVKPSINRRPVSGSLIGPHGGYTYAHIKPKAQLEYKRAVVTDQLKRLGNIKVPVDPFVKSPTEWGYDHDIILSPTDQGGFGLWDPVQRKVVLPQDPIKSLIEPLQHLMQDLDFDLPELRRLTLRASSNGEALVAFEVQDVEPPEILVDFTVSAAIVLPDRTCANLIGDSFVVRQVNGQLYRISAGCEFAGNPPVAGAMANKVVELANLSGKETVLDLYSGVGLLTSHLAQHAAEVVGIDRNPDAIEDAAINLSETENVSLYEGYVEDILPELEQKADVIVVNPSAVGMTPDAVKAVAKAKAPTVIYVSSDVATLARDGKQLQKSSYRAERVFGFDTAPNTFQMALVAVFRAKK